MEHLEYPEQFYAQLTEDDGRAWVRTDFWLALEDRQGVRVYADALFHLTRTEFSPVEARDHMFNILAHHATLCDCLGRHVSLRATVCDYFVSLQPMLKDPVLIEPDQLVCNERGALLDELTGLYNRRFFNRELQKEIERAKRQRRQCSLLMADVDLFKRFNDTYGHLAGDAALQEIARVLSHSVREVDQVVRYGGEEFAVILPQTCRTKASLVAERIRSSVEALRWDYDGSEMPAMTVSLGAATYPADADTPRDMVVKADQAMYRAKGLGRNRICEASLDLRRHQRFPLMIPTQCRAEGLGVSPGLTVNVSLEGLLYKGAQPIEPGLTLQTVLSDPKAGLSLPLTVRAVHSQKSTDGFFVGLNVQPESEWRDLFQTFVGEKTGAWH